jgi:hypothetical protein
VKPDPSSVAAETLHQKVLQAGEDTRLLQELLDEAMPDEAVLIGLLRRSVPVRLLEVVGTKKPWCDRATVLGQVVLHPRCPRSLSLRLLPQLYWRQLADVAATHHVPAAVRVRAEASLKDQLRDLRLGERVTLARIATAPLLERLLAEGEPKVLEALLNNPRLREEDLLAALRRRDVTLALVEASSSSPRWSQRYFVRLELVLQPKTPLGVALLQMSSLVKRDLRRVAETPSLRPLLRVTAERLLAAESPGGSGT